MSAVDWNEQVTLQLSRGELAAIWRVLVAVPVDRKVAVLREAQLEEHATSAWKRINEAIDRGSK